MIPNFPEFKKLEWNDRSEVESFTKKFAPYSNFNFISTWAWDIKESIKLSRLNDNLVFLFYDFLNGKHYYSFIGTNKPCETADCLLNCTMNGTEHGILKYIPEEVVQALNGSNFTFRLNEGNCDYIVSVSNFANMNKCSGKYGQHCRGFIKSYIDHDIRTNVSSLCDADIPAMRQIFIKWAEHKKLDYALLPEYDAFDRYCRLIDVNIKIISVYDNEKMIGFKTIELLSNEFAMNDFFKADINYKGVYQFIDWKFGEFLNKQGIKYINCQVDLGIDSLRKAKLQYRPAFLLKSYYIEKVKVAETITNEIIINEKNI